MLMKLAKFFPHNSETKVIHLGCAHFISFVKLTVTYSVYIEFVVNEHKIKLIKSFNLLYMYFGFFLNLHIAYSSIHEHFAWRR